MLPQCARRAAAQAYEALAVEDRARYSREMASYTPHAETAGVRRRARSCGGPHRSRAGAGVRCGCVCAGGARGGCEARARAEAGRARRAHAQPLRLHVLLVRVHSCTLCAPTTPRGRRSKQQRQPVRSANPSLSMSELTSVLAAQWRGLPAGGKSEFEAAAAADKARYAAALCSFDGVAAPAAPPADGGEGGASDDDND